MTHQIKRLTADDIELARSVFAVMATVFGENAAVVSRDYAAALLHRDDFLVVAGLVDGEPIAGLTAFVLPLTRAQTDELFIYDIAVAPAHQRQGIGRRLVQAVRSLAAERNIATTWVPADNEDDPALEFYRAIGGTPHAVTVFTFTH
ncbi:MAG: GNAT family N-acetyltransferase [Hyphomicrobiaceae bacterium]